MSIEQPIELFVLPIEALDESIKEFSFTILHYKL